MVFAGGAVLYAAGKIYSHARSLAPNGGGTQPTWIEAAGVKKGDSCDAAARIELVERLAFVGQPWCVEVLQSAQHDERDPSVCAAIKAAQAQLSRR